MIYKFQKIPQTSKIHSKSSVTPNAKFYICKMIRKIQSIHMYWFHACLSKLTYCLWQNKLKHPKWSYMSLEIESLVQNGSNPSGFSCINQIHSCLPCLMHTSYCCILFGDDCVSVLSTAGSAPEEYRDYPNEEQYQCIDPSGKQNPLVHSDTILLSRSCSLLLH